jgi:hypothetical protein
VSAGGNYLCVWDLLSGGRLLRKLANFQKTVSCVALSPLAGPESGAAPRMLAGSLDGHVKVSDFLFAFVTRPASLLLGNALHERKTRVACWRACRTGTSRCDMA